MNVIHFKPRELCCGCQEPIRWWHRIQWTLINRGRFGKFHVRCAASWTRGGLSLRRIA